MTDPIDIAELRRRIDRCTWKGPECSVFVTQATLAALLDEVERLRAVAGATKSPP